MKYAILIFLCAFYSCSNAEKSADSSLDDTGTEAPSRETASRDAFLLNLTREVMTAIKNRDYKELSQFIHPSMGIRFSPYGYIDTLNHTHFSRQQFLQLAEEEEPVFWGSYDGTGKAIKLTLAEYFDKLVYEVDFLNAEQVSVNEVLGTGNSLINILQVYLGADFTESYFSGFEERFAGMDWRSLRLVFQAHEDQIFLVAVVHDQWTI
jgi:hypothetical protein